MQTSISDDEIYHETVKTNLWHIRYLIEDSSTGGPPVSSAVGTALRTEPRGTGETVRSADPYVGGERPWAGRPCYGSGSLSPVLGGEGWGEGRCF